MGAGVPCGPQNRFEGLVASWVSSILTYSRHFLEDEMNKELLRKLPKIDELMMDEGVCTFVGDMTREKAVDVIREFIDSLRKKILSGEITDENSVAHESIISALGECFSKAGQRSLRPVVNATGVVLHTNLGRANLSKAALDAIDSVASSYSTLEYDAEKGSRGSRHTHVEKIIREITGAEAGMVVNNNAAATMLAMAAIGRGKEMIVSRGELVEIGGSFRVPEIMEESGVTLVEIGTTNKTNLKDYESHITENTAALLKVHTSNYKIIGFTESVSVKELRKLGDKYDIPVIYDMGSGLMTDLHEYGIDEPTVKNGLADGADVILFSGDKLLGGPQAGIIAGKKEYIDRMKSHPLARVLRVDKMTLAAMEATFADYYNDEKAKENIPVLRMITKNEDELRSDCEKLREMIEAASGKGVYEIDIICTESVVGGGTSPGCTLSSYAIALGSEKLTTAKIERELRKGEMPVVSRIHEDKIILDVRTLFEDDFEIIANRLKEIAL